MSTVPRQRGIRGVEFVVNEDGDKKAVLIDLKQHKNLWEDFYDTVVAEDRRAEPRESLDDVKKKVRRKA